MSKYTKPKPKAARPKRKRAARPSAGSRGGYRAKAGRPKGARGKLKQLREEERLEIIRVLGTPDDPKEFLKAVMAGAQIEFPVRFQAACQLMPYYHPRLSSMAGRVEVTGKDGGPIEISDRDRARALASLIAKIKAHA